jgi:cytochrome b561
MQKPEARYDSISILLHWITAILIFVQITFIWHMQTTSQDTSLWNFHFNLHLLIGTINFLVVVFWIAWRLIHKPPGYPATLPSGERYLARITYFVFYVCLLLLPLSGYLKLEFGPPITFMGIRLQFWGDQDDLLYAQFSSLHTGLTFLLIGLILVHIAAAIFHLFRRSGIFSRMLLSFRSPTGELMLPGFTGPSRKYQHTSTNFLVFGWLAFLVQLLIAIITVLLLVFATSGNQAAQSGVSGNESSIFWAQCGVISMFVTIIFFYITIRYAKKIKQQQDVELHAHKARVMYLLRFGLFSGFIGITISMLGVTASVELLIGKTISQPPGIAITDPSKIVRALDVFVLVSNFAIVIAHFFGLIISLWLLNRVDRNF